MNNNNNSNNNGNTKMKSKNFNKVIKNAVKDSTFKNATSASSKSIFQTEKDYQASFTNIINFSKKIKDADKKKINLVIFHKNKNDGVVAAYIAWRYLVHDGGAKDVKFVGMLASHGDIVDKRISNMESMIKDKNVIILDLAYGNETFAFIKSKAKSMIVIDDHQDLTNFKNDNLFSGENHGAVAFTWKFFYPKDPVPKIIQYVDNSDAKLFMPFLPFSNLFSVSLGFRYVHNVLKNIDAETFEELHELFKDDNVNFWIYIGKYFEEVRDNLKDQIANNARVVTFQGHKVGVLNFNAPSLSKPVGRQINSNFNKNGRKTIDFAVLWGYEYSANPPAYRVQIIDDHVQTAINMGKLAEDLGKKGGHPKRGGGHAHIGNFYWMRDINELFK